MITPNKFTPLDKTVLSKLRFIVEEVGEEINVVDLYKSLQSKFETIQDFILALDVLHVLNRIEVDLVAGTVRHAD